MKKVALYIGFFLLLMPQIGLAQTIPCSAQGYTVVFVNGVFDTLDQARADKGALELAFIRHPEDHYSISESVTFRLGYNPTHLAGFGDLVQSLAQNFSYSVSDYDLQTILMQIYPEVTTRKLLIVGHSQGAYYTGEMYNYLLAHGEPKEAVNVYDVGTPAPKTVAGGKYLNSSSDLLLTMLRDTLHFNVLPSNITIPLIGNDITSTWPGHSFVGAYLAGAPDRVVSDISGELSALVPTDSANTGGCFTPPDSTLGYKTERAIFTVADPAAVVIKVGAVAGWTGAVAIGSTVVNGATTAFNFMSNIFPAFTVNVTNGSTDEKNFTIIKKLYGSSVDVPVASDSQGGAVALAFGGDKPIAVNGGYVEGTSTGPDSNASESTTSPVSTSTPPTTPYPSSSGSSPTQVVADGDQSEPVADPVVEDPAPDTSDATTTEDATSTPPVPTPTPPALVINEIEWAGDAVDPGREWIELKNLSAQSVDLSNLAIVATDGGSQYIPLSGTIAPSAFFTVQRNSSAPFDPSANISLDFSTIMRVIPFDPLNDAGEQLALMQVGDWGTTTIDETPPLSACNGWCAGISEAESGYTGTFSMERIDANVEGDIASNWASNDGYTASANMPGGQGQVLYATVNGENSKHWGEFGWFCDPDTGPITPGQTYHFESSSFCRYLVRFIPWPLPVEGGIFKGVVGSSTLVSFHYGRFPMDGQFTAVENIDMSDAQPGDQYFVAIWGPRFYMYPDVGDTASFQSYFTTGHPLVRSADGNSFVVSDSTNPPTDNYRVIPFTYGP